MLRLHVNPFDYTILGIYFALVVAIGVIARRAMGIGMLVIGVFFTTWWRLSPLWHDQPPSDATGTGP